MKVKTTPRGYQSIEFTDQAGKRGVLEQTGGTDYGNPTWDQSGTSYVLLGRKDAPIQLNIDQVGELVEHLQAWLEDGRFCKGAELGSEMRKTA
jgi:hypothetical protein